MTTGAILAYLLHSAMFLSLGYAAYRLCLARMKMPAFNRAVIMAIYAVAFMAPAMMSDSDYPADTDESAVITDYAAYADMPDDIIGLDYAAISDEEQPSGTELTATLLAEEQSENNFSYKQEESEPEKSGSETTLMRMACALAFAGAGLLLLQLFCALGVIMKFSRRGEHMRLGHTRLVLLDEERIAPFSLLNLIFISRNDYLSDNRMILEHELSHIRYMHFIDLIISKITLIAMWWNPMAWLLHRELRAVHEFQADAGVLKNGHEIKDYQLLLIKTAAGVRLPSVASSLNHSKLKQRFTMMYQNSPSRWAKFRAAALIPAFCGAFFLSGQASFASIIEELSDIRLMDTAKTEIQESVTETSDDKITQNKHISQDIPAVTTSEVTANIEESAEEGISAEPMPREELTEEASATGQTDATAMISSIEETATAAEVSAGTDSHSISATETEQAEQPKETEQSIADTNREIAGQNAAKARENAAKARQNAATARENAAKARENAAKARQNAAKARENAEKARQNAATARKNAAKARKNAAKARENAATARKNAKKAAKNGRSVIIINGSSTDNLSPEQIRQLEQTGISLEQLSAQLEKDAQSFEALGQNLKSIDWESMNKLKELGNLDLSALEQLKSLDNLDLSALEQLNGLDRLNTEALDRLKDSDRSFTPNGSASWADDRKNGNSNLSNPAVKLEKSGGKDGKLSCEVLSVSNANGTTISLNLTSSTTITVNNASAVINDKHYDCKVIKSSTSYNNGKYYTKITLKINKKITTFKNKKDYVTLTTSAGTARAYISYF